MREIHQGVRYLRGGRGAKISGGRENCRIYKRLQGGYYGNMYVQNTQERIIVRVPVSHVERPHFSSSLSSKELKKRISTETANHIKFLNPLPHPMSLLCYFLALNPVWCNNAPGKGLPNNMKRNCYMLFRQISSWFLCIQNHAQIITKYISWTGPITGDITPKTTQHIA